MQSGLRMLALQQIETETILAMEAVSVSNNDKLYLCTKLRAKSEASDVCCRS